VRAAACVVQARCRPSSTAARSRAASSSSTKTWIASQNEWFYSSILDLDVDGKTEQVLLRDMQRHPFKQLIMHLDFQRVDANEAIRTSVPLHFLNEEKSPAGKAADVVITHELNEVQSAACRGPARVHRDRPGRLTLGDIVHLSEIKLPKGVEIPELKLGKEHDVAVVVAKRRVEVEDTRQVRRCPPRCPRPRSTDEAAPGEGGDDADGEPAGDGEK
jgi:large subunit ribosomal protein L25